VEILLENIPNGFCSAARLNMFLEQTHLDLNYCFDVGHANLTGDPAGEFELMRTRIKSTHLHDNDGKQDNHLFPLLHQGGTIDWNRIVPLLATRSEQYPLLLELKEDPDNPQPLQAVRQIFERLDALTEPERYHEDE
jgi:sugar phosphate isomerase/epimerase